MLSLLSISWAAVFFALPQYNRFKHASSLVKILAIGQSYFLIIFAFVILAAAPSFGNKPECNPQIIIVIFFAPIKLFNKARIAGLVLLSLVTLAYTGLLYNDYYNGRPSKINNVEASGAPGEAETISGPISATQTANLPPHRGCPTTTDNQPSQSHRPTIPERTRANGKFDGRIVVTVVVIIIFSIAAIVNTELLRIMNKIQLQDTSWGFGQASVLFRSSCIALGLKRYIFQILPMFLTFLPLASAIQVFREHGLSPRTSHGRKKRKRRIIMTRLAPSVVSEGQDTTRSEGTISIV